MVPRARPCVRGAGRDSVNLMCWAEPHSGAVRAALVLLSGTRATVLGAGLLFGCGGGALPQEQGPPTGSVAASTAGATSADARSAGPWAGARRATLAAALLEVECFDVVRGEDTAAWAPEAVVVRGRLPEAQPEDVTLPLPDAVRAGLPLTRLPPAGTGAAAPCALGPPPGRPAQGTPTDELRAFATGRFHLELLSVEAVGGAEDVLETVSRVTVDHLGTRERFGVRHRLRVQDGADAAVDDGVPVTVLARRSWLEHSGPSTAGGPGTAYDAGYYASIDHGADRARARGDLGCAISRLAEGRRWRALVRLLEQLEPEDRFPYWSLYVAAAESTGQFRKANDYRAWVSASVDERAARRAAVGNLVDRCQRGSKGAPRGAAPLASDGPCTSEESAALAAGTAPAELFCHPPSAEVDALARGLRGVVAECAGERGGGGTVAYEARVVIHQNGVVDLAALGRVATPGAPAEWVERPLFACAKRAAGELPRVPFRLRPGAEGGAVAPTWTVSAELLVPEG